MRIQREAAQIALLDAEESLRKTKRALAVLLNLPPTEADAIEVRGSTLDRVPPPPPMDELIRIALAIRPDLVSFRLGVQRAEADVRLAMANRFTDVYLLYQPYTYQNNQPFGLKSPTSWALGVTVPLPIYNRNQGGIQRAKLNVTQTQIQLATLERQTITDVQQAVKEYEVTRQAVQRIEKDILPPAKQVLDDTYRLYIGGEVDVVDLPQCPERLQRRRQAIPRHRGPAPPEHARAEHGAGPARPALNALGAEPSWLPSPHPRLPSSSRMADERVDGLEEIRGLPTLSRGAHLQPGEPSLGVDHRRAEVVDDLVRARAVHQAERPGDLGELVVRGDREGPQRRPGPLDLGMFAEHLGRVVLGVEAHREQTDLLRAPGIASTFPASSLNLRSISGQKSGRGHRV